MRTRLVTPHADGCKEYELVKQGALPHPWTLSYPCFEHFDSIGRKTFGVGECWLVLKCNSFAADCQAELRVALNDIMDMLDPENMPVYHDSDIWCDVHGCIHESESDPYDEGRPQCGPDDWRKLIIGGRVQRTP